MTSTPHLAFYWDRPLQDSPRNNFNVTIMPALLMLARFYSVPDQSLMLDIFLQNSRYIKCHQHVKTCLLMNMSLIKERVY